MTLIQRTLLIVLTIMTMQLSAHAVISVQTLVEQGKQFDGRAVEIQGEVIGDIMLRGKEAWINVLSPEGVAIGVLCPSYLTTQLKVVGSYTHHGDEVRVSGIFHRFFKGQGGETMISGYALERVSSGYAHVAPLSMKRVAVGIVALLVGLVLWILYIRFIKKIKKPSARITHHIY